MFFPAHTIISLVIVVVIIVLVVSLLKRSAAAKPRLASLADQLQGTVARRSPGGPGAILLTHRGRNVWLEHVVPFYTRLTLEIRDTPAFRLDAHARAHSAQAPRDLPGEIVPIGILDFDEVFDVRTDDARLARLMLRRDVRDSLQEIARIQLNRHVEVRVQEGALIIDKLPHLHAPDLLRSFIEAARVVFDGYLRASGSIPDNARSSSPGFPPPAPDVCPVCGDTVEGEAVACPVCSCAHHPECFELNDGCGTCELESP